ncbi:hypothetical protein H2203_001202 [Taxawa tesnikishii (nom. ined.)]|nr:hypothetical protein H2203_001202 [Dothideales sp. JES 119]
MSSEIAAKGIAAYRAPSLFQPHQARKALRDAHEGRIPPLMCLYLGLSTVSTARFIAPFGYDAVWLDWEHSSCNAETLTTMIHETIFMSEGRTIPFVRIPGPRPRRCRAQHVVSAAKYGTKTTKAAVTFQIETLEGIDDLDAILTAVPDVDACWLGTLDCRVSMNLPGNGGFGGTDPEWLDAVAKYTAVMKKHDKPMAGFAMGPKHGPDGPRKEFYLPICRRGGLDDMPAGSWSG